MPKFKSGDIIMLYPEDDYPSLILSCHRKSEHYPDGAIKIVTYEPLEDYKEWFIMKWSLSYDKKHNDKIKVIKNKKTIKEWRNWLNLQALISEDNE